MPRRRELFTIDLGTKFNTIINAMLQPVDRSAMFTIGELVRFYDLADNLGKDGKRLIAILESAIQRAKKQKTSTKA